MTQGQRPDDRFPPEEFDDEQPVIRDRRRIDPDTGDLRPEASAEASREAPAESAEAAEADEAGLAETATKREAELAQQVAERTADLQRLQAEYLNYKRRVDRDKQAAKDTGIAGVMTELLPVLDDIGRAREHGELEGGFRAVAEALEAVVTKLGLEKYGEAGESFDPRVHEAMMHTYSDEVAEPTATAILQPGYRYQERVIRAARVAVSEPTETLPPQGEGAAGGQPEGPASGAQEGEAGQAGGGPGDEPSASGQAPGTPGG